MLSTFPFRPNFKKQKKKNNIKYVEKIYLMYYLLLCAVCHTQIWSTMCVLFTNSEMCNIFSLLVCTFPSCRFRSSFVHAANMYSNISRKCYFPSLFVLFTFFSFLLSLSFSSSSSFFILLFLAVFPSSRFILLEIFAVYVLNLTFV